MKKGSNCYAMSSRKLKKFNALQKCKYTGSFDEFSL